MPGINGVKPLVSGVFFYLDAISLQIGFPLEENFSSYSVMTLPSFKTASWCRSLVEASNFHPASGTSSKEKVKDPDYQF